MASPPDWNVTTGEVFATDQGCRDRSADTALIGSAWSRKPNAMSLSFKPLLLVAALGLVPLSYASAQPAPTAPAAKGGTMAMDGMMGMGPMHCTGLSEQHLSAMKAKLNITDRQLRAWNAFVAAAKAGAHPMPAGMTMPMKPGGMQGMMSGDGMMATMMAKPLPERLAHHEMMMKEHLKTLKKVRAAASALYRVLTPDQWAIADKGLCSGIAH